MEPLITVVTPSYHNASTIYDTIDSVLNQSYKKIQYIVTDDCTPDFDKEEIKNYILSRNRGNIVDLTVIKNPQNLGTVKNLNNALTEAKGIYLFNIAADDTFYDENVLIDWVDEFEKTDAQVITAYRAVCSTNLKQRLNIAPTKKEAQFIRTLTPRELFDKMSGSNFIFGCCTARTMQNYKLLGGYDERYPLIEDYPSNMKLLRQDVRIHFMNRIVINYRTGGISGIGNINEVYLQQADSIFLNEILPYASDEQLARKKYERWKKECKILADNAKTAKKIGKEKSSCRRFIYYLAILIKHPTFFLHALKNKISR